MLHYVVLSAMVRCAVLCCGALCCAVLCCAVLCYSMLFYAVLCCAVLCCAVLCCAVLCCAVVWCTVLYYYITFLFHSALHDFIYCAILRRYPTLLFPNPPTVPYPNPTFTSGRLGPACKRTRSSCMSVTSSGEEIKSWREDLRWITNDASWPACVLTCDTMFVCLYAWESVFV
jgi:hypothetical protein